MPKVNLKRSPVIAQVGFPKKRPSGSTRVWHGMPQLLPKKYNVATTSNDEMCNNSSISITYCTVLSMSNYIYIELNAKTSKPQCSAALLLGFERSETATASQKKLSPVLPGGNVCVPHSKSQSKSRSWPALERLHHSTDLVVSSCQPLPILKSRVGIAAQKRTWVTQPR